MFGAAAGALVAAFVAPGSVARAQTHVGNAYGARSSVSLVGGGATVQAGLAQTGNLPAGGGSLNSQVLNAGANITAGLNTVLTAADSAADADTNALFASTVGNGTQVVSTATVDTLTLFPGFFLRNVGTVLSPQIVSIALLQADVVTSTTIANAQGRTGTVNIANLRFGGNQVVPTGTADQQFFLSAGGVVSNTSFGAGINGNAAVLTLNRQRTNNVDGSLTTDALVLEVLRGGSLAWLANAEVVVSSSTAGFTAAPSGGTTGGDTTGGDTTGGTTGSDVTGGDTTGGTSGSDVTGGDTTGGTTGGTSGGTIGGGSSTVVPETGTAALLAGVLPPALAFALAARRRPARQAR